MDPLMIALAARGGVASVADLADAGLSRQHTQMLVRQGRLVRVRRNALVDAEVWRAAAPWERHGIRARAVMRSRLSGPGAAVALSHHSALALLGFPVYGVDDLVHMVRTDDRDGRRSSGLVVHRGIGPLSVQECDGLSVVPGALACLQVADAFGVEAGLVSADAVMRAGVSRAELSEAVGLGRFGRGAAHVSTVIALASPQMESPGESRARWLLRVLGLPEPEPQVLIRDSSGFAARVDFLFRRERTIVEFDGMLKYTSPEQLRAEKVREDHLRRLGFEVVRLTWADLEMPQRVHAMVTAAFKRAVHADLRAG